ncbi:hypothetical protein [Azospirillum rugosum]|uniref:ZIP Zinc transporter n=1 Tax=Azospirillum rugosum TaxID=416170 RepID=A0ABS4SR58_9PROT|nr:hypothetical protein [Azospirillum rugosum]MBP2295051.1 hypothetical protein [Azospirillum rugosum]MDQ0528874.1 hypothetical protein [Azospirillum rugosum]
MAGAATEGGFWPDRALSPYVACHNQMAGFMSVLTITVLAAMLLALVHVLTPSLRFLEGTPRSVWLSIAGGVSVAYVFIHFLPELAAGQESVGKAVSGIGLAERHVYFIALAGLLTFYGLDRLAKTSRSRRQGEPVGGGRDAESSADAKASGQVFWVHMASFSVYNALVGYLLLHREVMTFGALAFFTIAMALHFIVTDYSLTEDHKSSYRHVGRWILVGAVFVGWAIGVGTEVSDAAIAALTAFLGGGIVLNVLKEEVPSERRSRFWAFALGVIGYALLLTAV